MNETLLIGQVAQRAGISVQALRFYERRGLLPKSRRRASGYRQYSEGAPARVRFIKRAQELGFSLSEVKGLLHLKDSRTCCDDVRASAESKIRDVERRLADLSRIRAELRDLVLRCESGAKACPMLEALEDASRGRP